MSESEDSFQKAMNQGHSAAWDQNWGRAAAFYRQALEVFPDRPQALTSLGLACIELQEYEEALRCYQKAARLLPDDPLPLEKIGQLCERTGSLEHAAQAYLRAAELHIRNKDAYKAVENWEQVTRVSPENLHAHSRLALIYERIGEKPKAVSEYLVSASLLQAAGTPEKARQSIEQALQVMPGSQEAELYLGMLRDFKPLPRPSRARPAPAPAQKGAVPDVLAASSAQPELDPVSEAVTLALKVIAEMLFESDGEHSTPTVRRGLQEIVSGVTEAGDNTQEAQRMVLYLSQVVVLQASGEFEEAASMLQRAIEAGFEHSAAQFDLGYLSVQLGRPDQAVNNLQRAVRNPDFALGARLLLGDLFYRKGNLREASLEYLQALKLADTQLVASERSKELDQLYELLVETHRQQADNDQQARLCENIRKMLARSDWRTQIRSARQQLPDSHEQGPPIPLAEVLTQVSSSQVVESIAAIAELSAQRRYQSAMEETYYALQLAPTYLPMHAVMGDVLVKIGDVERAVTKYEVISRAYASRGEMLPAVQFARKVVTLSPVDLGARARLIDLLILSGQVEQAIEEYMHLAEIHLSLADLTTARKTYMEAFKAAQLAGLDRKLKIRLLYRVADIDMQSMDWRQAMRMLEQIRTLQPDEEEARAQIIRLSLRLGQEQQAMVELDNYASYMTSNRRHAGLASFILRMLEEYPEIIPLRRRLVDTYIRAGQVGEAVQHLDTIGERLLQSGDRAGAIQTIETIVSLDPPNRADYLTLLSQLRKDLV